MPATLLIDDGRAIFGGIASPDFHLAQRLASPTPRFGSDSKLQSARWANFRLYDLFAGPEYVLDRPIERFYSLVIAAVKESRNSVISEPFFPASQRPLPDLWDRGSRWRA